MFSYQFNLPTYSVSPPFLLLIYYLLIQVNDFIIWVPVTNSILSLAHIITLYSWHPIQFKHIFLPIPCTLVYVDTFNYECSFQMILFILFGWELSVFPIPHFFSLSSLLTFTEIGFTFPSEPFFIPLSSVSAFSPLNQVNESSAISGPLTPDPWVEAQGSGLLH